METVKLFGQLLLSIIIQILFIIPKSVIFALDMITGLMNIVKKILEQIIKIVEDEVLSK